MSFDHKISGALISSISTILSKTTLANQYSKNKKEAIPKYLLETDKKLLKTSIEIILQNLHVVFEIDMSTIIVAVIYFDKLLRANINISKENVRDYLIGCLVIAVKYNEEFGLLSKVWGCSRLGLYNIEVIEFEVLQFLDYCIHVPKEVYDIYEKNINKHSLKYLRKEKRPSRQSVSNGICSEQSFQNINGVWEFAHSVYANIEDNYYCSLGQKYPCNNNFYQRDNNTLMMNPLESAVTINNALHQQGRNYMPNHTLNLLNNIKRIYEKNQNYCNWNNFYNENMNLRIEAEFNNYKKF